MNRPGRLFSRYALFAFILAVFVAFLLWPIGLTVSGAFVDPDGGFTTRYFFGDIGVFSDSNYRAGIRNSLIIATATTIVCLLMALPLAALSTRYEFPGKALLSSLVMVPLILPPFVGAIGLRSLLGRYGALNALLVSIGILPADHPGIDFLGEDFIGGRFTGIVIAEALHLYPILFLNVTAAMANLDPALDEAAQGLGASRWTRFSRITLPLITPGVFAGATIVFIWSFTELGTPLMFDFHEVTPVQIFYGLQEVQTSPRPYALVVVMLGVAVGLYLFSKWLVGGKSYEMQGKASIASSSRRLGGFKGAAAMFLFLFVIGLAVLPHIGVIISSFTVDGQWYRSILPTEWTTEHYANALTHNLAVGSIRNSLLYASIAMVLCITIGLAIAYLNVRVKIKGGWVLDSLAMLPLAVPGLVMAFGFVAMSLNWPFPQLAEVFRNGFEPSVVPVLVVLGITGLVFKVVVTLGARRAMDPATRSTGVGLLTQVGAFVFSELAFIVLLVLWATDRKKRVSIRPLLMAVCGLIILPLLTLGMVTLVAGGHLAPLSPMMQVTGQAPNPLLFLIVAYAIRRLPYVVRSASAGLQQTSGQLEEAALNLGATPMTAIRRIVVPLIMANLIAGGILAFSFAMLEVSDSLVLAQKEQHYPITKAIYDLFIRLGDGPYIASAMGVWGMALLTVTLVGAGMMMGKKLGAIFRV